jgi:hypothetical protein
LEKDWTIMSLLAKIVKNLTEQERASLIKRIGTQDAPYPGVYDVINEDGSLKQEIGAIASDGSDIIKVASTRPYEQVVGLAYCNMAIPSALRAEREAFEKLNPDMKTKVMMLIGKAGWGKTQMAENFAMMMDSRSPIFVNCSDRNLEDLAWTTVIDPGEDYKTAIRNRIRNGNMMPDSIETLEKHLGHTLVRDESGKVVDIDFHKVPVDRESGQDVLSQIRNKNRIYLDIAKNEAIPMHSANVVGVRKIPGPIKKAYSEGLILIPDEFTKGLDGSEAQLLEFLQWASGLGKDEITLTSTMSVNGKDETVSYTLRRSEMKAGFCIMMTGNLTDPMLQRMEASPIFSRVPKLVLPDPDGDDWEHRISQMLTGAPVTTLYSFFHQMAQDDPDNFTDLLCEWRQAKAEAEGQPVPPGQQARLQSWEKTLEAVKKVASGFYFAERLANSKSDLYGTNKAGIDEAARDRKELVAPELGARFSASTPIDPRIFGRLVISAEQGLIKVLRIGQNAYVPRFNRRSADGAAAINPASHNPGAQFGTALQRGIESWVAELTAGRPNFQKAIVKDFRERGIAFTLPGQANTLADLLDNLSVPQREVHSTIVADTPAITRPNDGDIKQENSVAVPVADSMLAAISAYAPENARPRQAQVLIPQTGSDEAGFPQIALAVDTAAQVIKPDTAKLVNSTQFMASLTIPEVARINLQAIMRRAISAEALVPGTEPGESAVRMAENTHESGMSITTLMTLGADGAPVPLHVMQDNLRNRTLVVTDKVDPQVKSQLGSHYVVVAYDDPRAESRVAAFIRDSLIFPGRKENLQSLERVLTRAFMLRAGDERRPEPLSRMMTRKELPAEAAVYLIKGLE